MTTPQDQIDARLRERQVAALERIAAALERAFPPSKSELELVPTVPTNHECFRRIVAGNLRALIAVGESEPINDTQTVSILHNVLHVIDPPEGVIRMMVDDALQERERRRIGRD